MSLNLPRVTKRRDLKSTPLDNPDLHPVTPREIAMAEAFLDARALWARRMKDRFEQAIAEGRDPTYVLRWDEFQSLLATRMGRHITAEIQEIGAEDLKDALSQVARTDAQWQTVQAAGTQAARVASYGGSGGSGVSPPSDPLIPPLPGPGGRSLAFQLRLDLINPFAVRHATTHVLDLAGRVSTQSRTVISRIVTEATQGQLDVIRAGQQIFEVLGLDPRWANAVRNFEAGMVKRGVEPEVIDQRVSDYARKLRKARAMRVARTEIMRAANFGRLASWDAVASMGLLDKNATMKEWSTGTQFAPGEGKAYGHKVTGPCKVCGPMDGVMVRGIDTEFELPNGRRIQVPPAHPHCRCVPLIHPPEVPDPDEYG